MGTDEHWEQMNILNIPAEILISEEKKKEKKVVSGMTLNLLFRRSICSAVYVKPHSKASLYIL